MLQPLLEVTYTDFQMIQFNVTQKVFFGRFLDLDLD